MVRWRNWEQFNGLLRMLVTVDSEFFNTGSSPVLTAKDKSYEKNVICPILSFSNDYLNIIACILYSILKTNSQVAEGTRDPSLKWKGKFTGSIPALTANRYQ